MGKIIQVKYDQVSTSADQFGRQADQVSRLLNYLRLGVDDLQSGGWEGSAANAFFNEMECDIFPALNRLANALDASKSHTLALNTRFRDAEEEASRWFLAAGSVGLSRPGGLGDLFNGITFPAWLPDLFSQAGHLLDASQIIAVLTHMRAGSYYPGEVVFTGSRWFKEVFMGLDSGYLTHIQAQNFTSRLGGIPTTRLGVALAAIGLGLDWVQDWQVYGPRGPEYAVSAMVADTGQTVLSWAAAAKGAAIGAGIGTAFAPGVGTAVGGLVGAFVGGFAVDYVWDTPITTIFHDTSTLAMQGLAFSAGPIPGVLSSPLANQAGDWMGDRLSFVAFGPQCTDVSIKDYAVDAIVGGGRAVGSAVAEAADAVWAGAQSAAADIGQAAGAAGQAVGSVLQTPAWRFDQLISASLGI